MRTDDDTNRLTEEIGNIKWQVAELSKTKRRGEGLRELSGGRGGGGGERGGGSWMYAVGETEETPDAKGLALIVNKNFTDYIEKRRKTFRQTYFR